MSCVTAWMIPHYLEVSSSFSLAAELQDSWGSRAWREQGTSDLLLLLCSCQSVLGIGTTTSLSSRPFPEWDLFLIIPAFCSFSHSGLEQ